jgi:hypothetical protein
MRGDQKILPPPARPGIPLKTRIAMVAILLLAQSELAFLFNHARGGRSATAGCGDE